VELKKTIVGESRASDLRSRNAIARRKRQIAKPQRLQKAHHGMRAEQAAETPFLMVSRVKA
jgi:hypothetical protein